MPNPNVLNIVLYFELCALDFNVIVSNPPYSVRWKGDEDPTLINDDRFAPAGVLACGATR